MLDEKTSKDVASRALNQAPSKDFAVAAATENAAKPKLLVRFRDDLKSDTVDMQQGEYRRRFDAKDQPFAVEKAELQQLLSTGLFVADKEAGKAAE